MIDWIMDPTKGNEAEWQSVNHTTINSLGFEAGVNVRWSIFNVGCHYGYIHQDKQQEAGIVSQYALEYLRHKLVAKAQMLLTKRLALGVNLRWQDRIGAYTDFEGQVCDYEPYALVDTKLTWAQDRWKAYIEANNCFDTSYHDYGLVVQPGRWLIAGFSISL
jgi:iron complex outermembrane receptor protein